jgi:hypothetical protein
LARFGKRFFSTAAVIDAKVFKNAGPAWVVADDIADGCINSDSAH